jgi:hypothetical protein
MATTTELRLQRWERMRQRGMLRFALTQGTMLDATFLRFAWLTTSSDLPWLYLTIMFLIAGWVWGALMWLVSMRMYRHRRQRSQ